VQVNRGGDTTAPEKANIIAYEPMILRNSEILSSIGWGVLKRASDTTDYLSTNTFTGNTSGAVGTLP
jgi:hypothetical protein